MTSTTDICNRALAEANSRSTISSLAENSPSAIMCRRFFESTRDELLAMAWWGFAEAYVTLSLLKALPGTPEATSDSTSDVWIPEFPPPGWLYSYAYPSDCIAARMIVPQAVVNAFAVPPTSAPFFSGISPYRYWGPVVKWKRASDTDETGARINVIATNQSQAILCYTIRNTDPSTWEPNFINALVYGLAGKLSIPLSGKRQMMIDNYALANKIVLDARAIDGNEGITAYDQLPDWLAVRSGVFPQTDNWPLPSYGPLFGVGGV